MLLVRFIATVDGGEPLETSSLVNDPTDIPQVVAILGANLPGIIAALETEKPLSFIMTVDKVLKTLPSPSAPS